MGQLSFPFQDQTDSYLEEDFVFLPENVVARNFLEKFFAQKDFNTAPLPSLILKGADGSGKTHLLNIFSRKVAVEFVDLERRIFTENHFYVFEDLQKCTNAEKLLALINLAAESRAFLLLTMREMPRFHLNDLKSRLKNIFVVEIENPSREALEQLLLNRLARRQIKLSRHKIKNILHDLPMSYAALSNHLSQSFPT